MGLTAWVYEDWEWEDEGEAGAGVPTGRVDQLDPDGYKMRHPQMFRHRSKGPEPDRETLAKMFERSEAIVLVAPRDSIARL